MGGDKLLSNLQEPINLWYINMNEYFNFESNNIEIKVSKSVDNIDEWKVKKAQTHSFSKESEIVTAFNNDFPSIKLLGETDEEKYDFLTNVCSRSSSLLEWFANQKIIYSELAVLPNYLEDKITPSEYTQLKDQIKIVNDTIAEFTNRRIDESEKYKRKIKELNLELDNRLQNIKVNNNVLKILTLTSQSLPLSMAVALQEYNAKTDVSDFEEKQKLYVRELLTEFKIALLEVNKNNPEVDIDRLIEDISLK